MSEELFHQDEQVSEVLQQVSSQLRLSLGNIHSALARLAPPDVRDGEEKTDLNAAVLSQSYYRILRLANNLADASEPERPEGAGLVNEDIVELCRSVMERAQVRSCWASGWTSGARRTATSSRRTASASSACC